MSAEAWPVGRPMAIAWDLDGTLVDSVADLRTALNRVLEQHGLPPHDLGAVRGMVGHGVARLLTRGFEAAGRALIQSQVDEMVPGFIEVYRALATRETRLFPGLKNLVRAIHEAGIAQAVCTNKPEAISRQILSALEVDQYFADVVGGDTTAQRKPHPLPLLTCLEALGAVPGNSLMVGDSETDVATARAAGVRITVVSWGYTQVAADDMGADGVLRQPVDCSRWPAWLGQGAKGSAGS